MDTFPIARKVEIPEHNGAADLLEQIAFAGMHVEGWSKKIFLSFPFRYRSQPCQFLVGRISSVQLGFAPGTWVTIKDTKEAGQAHGLRLMCFEKILALRLDYRDQPMEWMRVAMRTHTDTGGSPLDFAIVNDGARMDVRTNWAFPNNQFQAEHEWFWELV